MSTLTTAQKSVSHSADFRAKFGILHKAAIGVILCRTHEPHRLIDTLKQFAWGEKDMEFRQWSVTTGWSLMDKTRPNEVGAPDNTVDAIAALRKVMQPADNQGFASGVFPMLYPNVTLDRNPVFMQWIKEASRLLPELRKRLVLVCPPGYVLPAELQTDVVVLDFDLPSYLELKTGFEEVLLSITNPARRPKFAAEDVDTIIANGAGMTMHEFVSTLSRALMTHSAKLPAVPASDIASEILKVKTEAVARTETLEVVPVENMNDVGGVQNLKDWVKKRRACFTQEARDYGIESPKGLLLAGPPGTGKSLLAKAIANELGISLIKLDISKAFGSLVGQSEARMDQALKMAEAMSPCVLLIDEVDKSLGGSQNSGGDSGVGKRILGKLLNWLQENTSPVFVVFSANRVTDLPSELLRRGRVDEIFSVSVPDKVERLEIVKIHLRKRGKSTDDIADLALAVEKEGYVPAELEAAVKDALIEAFTAKTPLTGKLIAQQLDHMVPLSVAFADDFAAMQNWAEQNARPASAQRTIAIRSRRTAPTQAATGARSLDVGGASGADG